MKRRLAWLLSALVLLTLLVGCTQDDPGFAVVQTPSGTEALIDEGFSNAIVIVPFEHHEVHMGAFYLVKAFADGTQTFLFVTPNTDIWGHAEWSFAAEGEFELFLYEDVSTSNDGAALIEHNAERNSANVATIVATSGPTLAGGVLGDGGQGGDLLWAAKIGAGPTAGESRAQGHEVIWRTDTKYWFQLTQTGQGTLYVDWDFNWYEHTNPIIPAGGGAMGINVLFGVLAFLAGLLTWSMFRTRQMMLGFPCAMFWVILGGVAYTESTTTWDLQYLMFFASMGMTIFSVLAMYGLRTKKQEIQDGDPFLDERGEDDRYFDEGRNPEGQADPSMEMAEAGDSMQFSAGGGRFKKSRGVRNRAAERRTRRAKKRGEFEEFG